MKNVVPISLCLALLAVGPLFAGSVTLATFQDPTDDYSTPMFTFTQSAVAAIVTVSGGWNATNLDLYFPQTGQTYYDATFTVSQGLAYNGTLASGGTTGAGFIKFFDTDGDNPTDPVFQINFNSCRISVDSLAGRNNVLNINDGVTFSGSELLDDAYADLNGTKNAFSFAFTNFDQPAGNSYTVTSAFTSSTIDSPEPATLAMLSLGLLGLAKKKK